MTVRNAIKVGYVKAYKGNYADIVLRQGADMYSEKDRTIEETMLTRITSLSQALPDTNVDCLLAFDDTGNAYVLGVIGSDNQPLPQPLDPAAIYHKNKVENPFDALETWLTGDGKISLAKLTATYGPVELIAILINALDLIATSTVPAGGGTLSNAALITAEKLKLTEYQKV